MAADGIPTIGWSVDATPYERRVGMRLTYRCQDDGAHGAPVGSGVYATLSSICAAAVHDGVTPRAGGVVTIVIGERQRGFQMTTRHGIASHYSNRRRPTFTFAR